MNPLNQLLRETFLFSSHDLLANRAGRLTARQQARMASTGAGLKIGIAFFVIVMFGTLGLIAVGSISSGTATGLTDPELLNTLGIASLVISVIVVIGLFSSRNYMAATREKQILKAEGEAQYGKINANSAIFEIKIGRKKIRLITQNQLESFQVGTAYRVYYLPGPIPTILSAEVVGTESEAAQFIESEPPIDEDEFVRGNQKGGRVVILLGILTLGVPVAIFASANLPGILFGAVLVGLLVVSLAFVYWALK